MGLLFELKREYPFFSLLEFDCKMYRVRASATSGWGSQAVARFRRKALNSWAAIQDTFFSTKDIFERHRVVFTIGTSIASVATAWFGYSLRHLHETKVDQRLESIEKSMKNHNYIEQSEIKRIVNSGNISTPACIATAGTTLIIGYGFGWRGGKWYANRQFRKEQMKLLGQIKPKRLQLLGPINSRGWQLKFLKRPSTKSKEPDTTSKASERAGDSPTTLNSGATKQSC